MTWGGPARACLGREVLVAKKTSQRWHFQHGPIDLILGVEGDPTVCDQAIELAWLRFERVLEELVSELSMLRASVPAHLEGPAPKPGHVSKVAGGLKGAIAKKMVLACEPYGLLDGLFVTPMAAVAGCVAQDVLEYLRQPRIDQAWVNNGGDIAWFAPTLSERRFKVGIPEISKGTFITLDAKDQCWGIATSGWRGRSQSFGIADSVTVIAREAGQADVAATLIANQVSLRHLATDHPLIVQRPAREMKDDSDLGDRLVTVQVGCLVDKDVQAALDSGERFARTLHARQWIQGAALCLQGQYRVCGAFMPKSLDETRD
jgi:uncharacterized protein